jgi:hypothetical protein
MPVQNAHIESFQGLFRAECPNESWFLTLEDARRIIEAWRQDYNHASWCPTSLCAREESEGVLLRGWYCGASTASTDPLDELVGHRGHQGVSGNPREDPFHHDGSPEGAAFSGTIRAEGCRPVPGPTGRRRF